MAKEQLTPDQAPNPTTKTDPGPTPTTKRVQEKSGGDPRLPDSNANEGTVTVVTIGEPQPNGGIVANAPTDVLRAQKEALGKDAKEGEAKRYPFAVAEGRSITTTSRGILGPGEEVKAEDVGGQERLEQLVQKGVVVRP